MIVRVDRPIFLSKICSHKIWASQKFCKSFKSCSQYCPGLLAVEPLNSFRNLAIKIVVSINSIYYHDTGDHWNEIN